MNAQHQIRSLCLSCKHNNFDGGCEVFPQLIPFQFVAGEYHAYPTPDQHNKIVYQWIDRAEQKAKRKKTLAMLESFSLEKRNKNRTVQKA
jgi:hypothetical protein